MQALAEKKKSLIFELMFRGRKPEVERQGKNINTRNQGGKDSDLPYSTLKPEWLLW